MTRLAAHDAQEIDEAVAYTRNTLARADPVDDTDFTSAVHDERGRSDLYRILNSQVPPKARVRRRSWMAGAATALLLAGLGAAADATGIVPTGVIKKLARRR
jgi:hypothetical protein